MNLSWNYLVPTGFTGIVGDDTDGKLMLNDFQQAGVDTAKIKVRPGAKTGSVFCLSDNLGKRSLYVSPGANSLLNSKDGHVVLICI